MYSSVCIVTAIVIYCGIIFCGIIIVFCCIILYDYCIVDERIRSQLRATRISTDKDRSKRNSKKVLILANSLMQLKISLIVNQLILINLYLRVLILAFWVLLAKIAKFNTRLKTCP